MICSGKTTWLHTVRTGESLRDAELVDVDEEKLRRYHELYRLHSQCLPYDPATLRKEP